MTTSEPSASLAAQRTADPVVRRAGVQAAALDVAAVADTVRDPRCGAVVVFTGEVRIEDGGREVTALEYEAHPTAGGVVAQVAEEVAARTGATAVAAVHRTGRLLVGDTAVVVAASAPHRDVAFTAARLMIDEVKARVPVWKRQEHADGTSEWVACAVVAPPATPQAVP